MGVLGLRISDCQRQVSTRKSSISSSCATRVEDAVAAFGCGKAPTPTERAPTSTKRRTNRLLTQFSLLGNTVGGPGAEKPQRQPGRHVYCVRRLAVRLFAKGKSCYMRTTVPAYKSPAPTATKTAVCAAAEPRERAARGGYGEPRQQQQVADRATAQARDRDPDQRQRARDVAGDRKHPRGEEARGAPAPRGSTCRRSFPRSARRARLRPRAPHRRARSARRCGRRCRAATRSRGAQRSGGRRRGSTRGTRRRSSRRRLPTRSRAAPSA